LFPRREVGPRAILVRHEVEAFVLHSPDQACFQPPGLAPVLHGDNHGVQLERSCAAAVAATAASAVAPPLGVPLEPLPDGIALSDVEPNAGFLLLLLALARSPVGRRRLPDLSPLLPARS
ncbi:unnamed protein product, partial [Ectocarpus fasciculatus]